MKTIRCLIKCEAKSYADGRSFAFGDIVEVSEVDAKCLLKSGEAVITTLPVTCDAKGNDLPNEGIEAAQAAASKLVAPDGGTSKARKQRKLVNA